MGKKLPLPMVVELNRRLVKGYTHYKDDPRIVKLKKSVNDYNKYLWRLGLRDHQVDYAKFSIIKVVFTLIYRLGKLAIMTIGTLPGLVLFAPVFVATKMISIKKSREALAASTVKLQGRDVMATWKLLVALAFAPLIYALYTILLTYWTYHNRVQGYVPKWVPLWLVVCFGLVFFPSITFAALRIGETGMDIIKSLRPLVLSLNPTSANTLVKLREWRAHLSEEVTELINTLGPELYPDFDSSRVVADPFQESDSTADGHAQPDGEASSPSEQRHIRIIADDNPSQEPLPRNESFHNLSNIGFFSTRPSSRNSHHNHSHHHHSRSSSSGNLQGSALKPFATLSTKDNSFDEVSQRIRGAMRERGQDRRRKSEDGSWDMGGSSGAMTPETSEEWKKDV